LALKEDKVELFHKQSTLMRYMSPRAFVCKGLSQSENLGNGNLFNGWPYACSKAKRE
jgi:hypothetical protein